jgi:hypothetical protein
VKAKKDEALGSLKTAPNNVFDVRSVSLKLRFARVVEDRELRSN